MTSPLQQKIKITGPSVVTANRLADGAVIYRTADRNWSTKLGVAAIVSTSAAAGGLLADAKTDGLQAVERLRRARQARAGSGGAGEFAGIHPPQWSDRRSADHFWNLNA